MALTGRPEELKVETDGNEIPVEISISIIEMPYIYKVHQHLRNINPDAYEPNIIAIGPYHRDKEKTSMMETHKKRYLESILQRHKEITEGELFSAVAEIGGHARAAYSDCVEIRSPEFEMMLVRDGCFIVELVRKFVDRDPSHENDPIFQMEWMMNSLQRDLMLFENQIPFFVICKIYDVIEGSDGGKSILCDLLLKFFRSLAFGDGYKTSTNRKPEDVKHLLDLIHGSWEPPHDPSAEKFDAKDKLITSWRFIGSVTDLKESNVRFKKKKAKKNDEDSHSLFNIKFAAGTLKIPTLVIEDRTESFIRNLMAYEMYHPVSGGNFITDYALFLHCLINSSADAILLQLEGIIENWLGDDEAVAGFVNKIMDSVSGPKEYNFRYAKTFHEINRFHYMTVNWYTGLLKRNYFNTPLAATAFTLLLLGAVSNICTIIQTFKK